jgi:hypothetical protein
MKPHSLGWARAQGMAHTKVQIKMARKKACAPERDSVE